MSFNQIPFDKISKLKIAGYLFGLLVLVSSIFWAHGFFIGKKSAKETLITDAERIILMQEADVFAKDKLVLMLNDLGVKYPHIVLAQSMIETGGWSSKIFIKNNNLFGMKLATQRITTAQGVRSSHAYYNHWRESVYDYAFYQSRYLHKVKTEEQYFQYLFANYAKDSLYVEKIKQISSSKNIKKLFD
jgi:hypothetical protein